MAFPGVTGVVFGDLTNRIENEVFANFTAVAVAPIPLPALSVCCGPG